MAFCERQGALRLAHRVALPALPEAWVCRRKGPSGSHRRHGSAWCLAKLLPPSLTIMELDLHSRKSGDFTLACAGEFTVVCAEAAVDLPDKGNERKTSRLLPVLALVCAFSNPTTAAHVCLKTMHVEPMEPRRATRLQPHSKPLGRRSLRDGWLFARSGHPGANASWCMLGVIPMERLAHDMLNSTRAKSRQESVTEDKTSGRQA